MKKRNFATAAALLTVAVVTHAATRYWLERPEPVEGIVDAVLPSAVLHEDRPFQLHLPASYGSDPERRYPVIYVLDGSSQASHTARSAALLARIGVMPEVIVVGIPNVGDHGRERDYTPPGMRQDAEASDGPIGQADRFLAFLRDELIPRIDTDYRTARPRTLAGWSRGGLFVVHSLLAEPDLFDARLALSPALWREDDVIVTRLGDFLATSPDLGGFLFLSLGDEENPKMTVAFRHAIATLEGRAPRSLRWRAELTRGANHGQNAEWSTPVGLFALFSGETAAAP
jgi:predicted alpha/beta superfamily hydrolase